MCSARLADEATLLHKKTSPFPGLNPYLGYRF